MEYGVLKGRIRDFCRDDDKDPHSELLVLAQDEKDRIAINVRSSRGPVSQRLVEYAIVEGIEHPLLEHARGLREGWTAFDGAERSARGVDYIRQNMFRPEVMTPLTHTAPGPNNDLFERVESLVKRAQAAGAMVYAYGEKWGPEPGKPDQYFGFVPGNGVHKIHMNQGDRENKNAKYQDGALFVELPNGKMTGLFIKFQSQAWHTSEANGDPIEGPFSTKPIEPKPGAEGEIEPWPVVSKQSPYHLARIVGALVNPRGIDEGKEVVTIVNSSSGLFDKFLDIVMSRAKIASHEAPPTPSHRARAGGRDPPRPPRSRRAHRATRRPTCPHLAGHGRPDDRRGSLGRAPRGRSLEHLGRMPALRGARPRCRHRRPALGPPSAAFPPCSASRSSGWPAASRPASGCA